MIYCTGDLHGDVSRVLEWMERLRRDGPKENYLFQLGDAGLNYYLDTRDYEKKRLLQEKMNELEEAGIRVQILFVRGNHECRPQSVSRYDLKEIHGGKAYVEEEFPNLIFLKDGELYELEGRTFLILGGGYSKDFLPRILRGEGYWFDEQLDEEEFQEIVDKISTLDTQIYVLSHMMPRSLAPGKKEGFNRKNRTEYWLQTIREVLGDRMKKWISGHYHYNLALQDGTFEIIFDKIQKLE